MKISVSIYFPNNNIFREIQVAIGKRERVRKLDFELDALYINGSLHVVSAAAPKR